MKLYTLDNEFIKEVDILPKQFTGFVGHPTGTKQWFVVGKRHRIGGPAVEYASGTKWWFINNKKVTKEEHDLLYSIMKLKRL